MRKLTGAVVGCGRMGAFTSDAVQRYAPPFWLPLSHCEAMTEQPNIALVALCDKDPQALARAQQRYGVSKVYGDFNTLIDEVSPDILGVATRTPERPEIIERAVVSGVRALHMEKPLCNSVEQLLNLERLLGAEDVVCTYGTLRRYFPAYQRARDLALSGRFGALQQVQVCFGPASLFWTHPHSMDLILFMVGDAQVQRVSARFPPGTAASASTFDCDPILLCALLEFSSGVTGIVSQSGSCDVILTCSNGSITVESDGHHTRLRHGDGADIYWRVSDIDRQSESLAHSTSGGTRLALDRLVSALTNPNPTQAAADKDAIFNGQRLLFACAQSHLGGGVAVDPSQLDPDLRITGRTGDRYA